jgi:hypothetical protein
MSLAENIPNVLKGSAPTLLNAELANKVIDKINAMTNIKVTRSSYDAVLIGSDGITITLKDYDADENESSTDINADTVSMFVCINGTAVRKNIYFEAEE